MTQNGIVKRGTEQQSLLARTQLVVEWGGLLLGDSVGYHDCLSRRLKTVAYMIYLCIFSKTMGGMSGSRGNVWRVGRVIPSHFSLAHCALAAMRTPPQLGHMKMLALTEVMIVLDTILQACGDNRMICGHLLARLGLSRSQPIPPFST